MVEAATTTRITHRRLRRIRGNPPARHGVNEHLSIRQFIVASRPYYSMPGTYRTWLAQRLLLCLAAAWLWSGFDIDLAMGQVPEVVVSTDRQQIFEGESLIYDVLLNHCGADARPDLAGLKQYFDVQLIERKLIQQMSVVYRGSTAQPTERRGPQFTYRLTPKQSGELSIPSPTVEIDGTVYVGRDLTVNVTSARRQDLVRISIQVEPDTVYPLQSFDVQLLMDVKSAPSPLERRDPLDLVRELPDLSIPWVTDEELAKGLEPKQSWDRWISAYVSRDSRTGGTRVPASGVSINRIASRPSAWDRLFPINPSGGFQGNPFRRQQDRRVAFHPEPERVMAADDRGRKVEYWRYRFDRSFSVSRIASFEFGPATIKGSFVGRVDTRGRPDFEPIFAIADPVTVTACEPPLATRPGSYIGAIGHFRCGADLSPTEAQVGDPLTLTVWLQGRGTLDQALAPQLDNVPDVSGRFRIYEPTEETLGDQRRFTFAVRPLTSEVAEFPPIPLTYFDSDREEYVTIETEAIPVSIEASAALGRNEIAVAANAGMEAAEADSLKLRDNVTDSSRVRNEPADGYDWLLALTAATTLFLTIVVGNLVVRWRNARQTISDRQQAVHRARSRLNETLTAARDQRSAANGISRALTGLVADAAGGPEGGWTSADAVRQLDAIGAPEELKRRFQRVVEACDDARFGTMADAAQIGDNASSLLEDLAAWLETEKLVS